MLSHRGGGHVCSCQRARLVQGMIEGREPAGKCAERSEERGFEGQEQVLKDIVCAVWELELHPRGKEEQWPRKNSGLGLIWRNRSPLGTHGWASGYINLMAFEGGKGLLIPILNKFCLHKW